MNNPLPPPHATEPCPHCGGVLVMRRDKTAHRQRFCCEGCAYSTPLPLSLRLRLAGYPELPLFAELEASNE